MTLFEKIIETNLINFLIVLSVLAWIVYKFSLVKIIDKMADDITQKVQKSENDTKSTLNSYAQVKQSVKDTNKLKEDILNNAKNSILAQKQAIKEETKTKKQDIIEKLNASKVLDLQQIQNQTTDEIFLASLCLAKSKIEDLLNGKDSAKYHKKLIDNAIDELDNIQIIKGAGK